MGTLTKSIKWYLKDLFPLAIYIPVLLVILLLQIYIFKDLKSVNEFSLLTQMIIIPFMVLIISTHFFRNKLITVFELSLLGSWRNIALSRIIVFLIGISPFILTEFFVLIFFNNVYLLIPIVLSLLIYLSFSLFSSISPSQITSLTINIVLIILIPISAIEVIENIISLGIKSSNVSGFISYLITPLAAYQYYKSGYINITPLDGFMADIILFIFVITIYLFLFLKQEFKP